MHIIQMYTDKKAKLTMKLCIGKSINGSKTFILCILDYNAVNKEPYYIFRCSNPMVKIPIQIDIDDPNPNHFKKDSFYLDSMR